MAHDHDMLSSVALGADIECRVIVPSGNPRELASARTAITEALRASDTSPMPSAEVRWRMPRYFLPDSVGSFYWDVCPETDVFEYQTGECRTPQELVASQDAIRKVIRDRLGGRYSLAACGYMLSGASHRPLRFSGSHLNITFNSRGADTRPVPDLLMAPAVQNALLFFLATSPHIGIGAGFGPHWSLRSHPACIMYDVSESCCDGKGLLQPGRHEAVAAHETGWHYTHLEAGGWARGSYIRVLDVAMAAIHAHLAFHHTREVLDFLARYGIQGNEEMSWNVLRRRLSRTLLASDRIAHKVRCGPNYWSLVDFAHLRQDLYARYLPERNQIDWVGWAYRQCESMAEDLERNQPCGPLLGIDAYVKMKYLYEPLLREQYGLELRDIWPRSDTNAEEPTRSPSVKGARAIREQLYGLSILWHDFAATGPGLYEEVIAANPELAPWTTPDLEMPEGLPRSRARRRAILLAAYQELCRRTGGKITPAFAGFHRMGVLIEGDAGPAVHYHPTPNVLDERISPQDLRLVEEHCRLARVEPGPVIAHALALQEG